MGGLSGKATVIQRERVTSEQAVLLLDAGKSLFKGGNNNNQQASLVIAQGIAEAYMAMGYDAVAISASDVDAGTSFLDQTTNDGFPWISANLVDENGLPVAPSHVIKTVNSLKIAIIGLTDNLLSQSKYSIIEYQTPLTTLLKKITPHCEMIILLSNLPAGLNKHIATQFPEIDTIISSDRSRGKMAPIVVNQTLMTQTSSRGKYLGKLEIEWNGSNIWHSERLLPLSHLRKRIATIDSQIAQISQRENNQKTNSNKKISRLQLQKKRTEQEIENRIAVEGENSDQLHNRYKSSFIPVQPTNAPKEIESIVHNIDTLLIDN